MTQSTDQLPARAENRRQSAWWIAILVVLFWVSLPWFGLPGPHNCNDVTFVAPAIDFAQGRPMSAHIVREACEAFGGNPEHWLGHPPVYQQILGTWLRLFGVSNAALLWFQVTVCLALYGGLLSVMRRFDIHFGWSVPPALILFAGQFRTWGMRPEALGAALLILGVAWVWRKGALGGFLSGLFWTASALVLQQAGIYAGLFFLVAVMETLAGNEPARQRWLRVTAMLAGTVLPILAFLIGIRWELIKFFNGYAFTLQNGGGMSDSRARILYQWWTCSTLGWEGMELLMAALLLVVLAAGVAKIRDRFERLLLAAILIGLPVNIFIVRTGMHRLSFIYVLVTCAAFCLIGAWRGQARRLRIGLAAFGAGIAVVLSGPGLGVEYFRWPGNAGAILQELAKHHYSAIYFDDFAAWDIFHWQLPEKAQGLVDSKKLSFRPAREGELFIVQESEYQKAPLRLLGRNFHSMNLNYRRWDLVDHCGFSLLHGHQVGLDLEMH